MVLLGVGLVLTALVLAIYTTLEVLTTPRATVRGLPKAAWVPVVVLLPVLGPVVWLVAGRPAASDVPVAGPARSSGAPDDDDAFLRGLRARAEEQRRRGEPDGHAD